MSAPYCRMCEDHKENREFLLRYSNAYYMACEECDRLKTIEESMRGCNPPLQPPNPNEDGIVTTNAC